MSGRPRKIIRASHRGAAERAATSLQPELRASSAVALRLRDFLVEGAATIGAAT